MLRQGIGLVAIVFVGLIVLVVACAARPAPETTAPARINDSIPERAAALRAGDGRLKLDAEEQRYGIEAAKERRQTIEVEGSSSTSVVIPMPPPNDSGAFAPHDAGADK